MRLESDGVGVGRDGEGVLPQTGWLGKACLGAGRLRAN